jgi:hypothetical protein
MNWIIKEFGGFTECHELQEKSGVGFLCERFIEGRHHVMVSITTRHGDIEMAIPVSILEEYIKRITS